MTKKCIVPKYGKTLDITKEVIVKENMMVYRKLLFEIRNDLCENFLETSCTKDYQYWHALTAWTKLKDKFEFDLNATKCQLQMEYQG